MSSYLNWDDPKIESIVRTALTIGLGDAVKEAEQYVQDYYEKHLCEHVFMEGFEHANHDSTSCLEQGSLFNRNILFDHLGLRAHIDGELKKAGRAIELYRIQEVECEESIVRRWTKTVRTPALAYLDKDGQVFLVEDNGRADSDEAHSEAEEDLIDYGEDQGEEFLEDDQGHRYEMPY
ncbi:MAG TPA: hypothetical protein VLK82_18880 [Candidatus Tectomicrobia bacterium]|nr:hypothetical protein [Candidatus Tectomicrobia bacterium]